MIKRWGILSILLCMSFVTLWASRGIFYVVVVGVSDYQSIPSLLLPERDAQMIAALYKRQTTNVILLTGKYATKKRILQSLKLQFSRAQKEDMVVLAFSGHGYPGGFCPYDMTQNIGSGISYEEIQAILKQSKAKKKMVWADACFSGGLRIKGSSTRFPDENVDIVFFLSSRTNETSIENPFMTNGLFTTYLVRGLRGGADVNQDKKITAKELFEFVHKRVLNKSGGKQHPVIWGNFADDYVVMDWNR